MGRKQKKNRKKRPRTKKTSGLSPVSELKETGNTEDDIKSAILQGRGRRAFALSRKVNSDCSIDDRKRTVLIAAAYETYIRELLNGGHDEKACSESCKFAEANPGLCDLWALSLQVRMKLVTDSDAAFSDSVWRERLRRELVAPDDLKDTSDKSVRKDAEIVIEAWQLLDAGMFGEARRLLAVIGRRSLLVDWRLFLQGCLAAREGAVDEMNAAVKRIMPNTLAAALAIELKACMGDGQIDLDHSDVVTAVPSDNSEFTRLAVSFVNTFSKNRDNKRIVNPFEEFARALFKAGKQDALACLVCSIINELTDRYIIHKIIERLIKTGVTSRRVSLMTLRLEYNEDWLSIIEDVIHSETWSKHERGVLLQFAVLQEREEYEHECRSMSHGPFGFGDYNYDDVSELKRIGKMCAKCVYYWPELRNVYDVWRWVEKKTGGTKAVKAEAKAFPDDTEVCRRLVVALADSGDFKGAEKTLERITSLPGSRFIVDVLQANIIYKRVAKAFATDKKADICKWAEMYAGEDLFERVGIAARVWLMASNRKEKRERGLAMDAVGSPWLILFFCNTLSENTIGIAKLPLPLRRSLDNNPIAVVNGFMALANRPEHIESAPLNAALVKCLMNSLSHDDLPIDMVVKGLSELTLRSWHNAQRFVFNDNLDNFIIATHRLLHSGDDSSHPVVSALVFRAYLHGGYAFEGGGDNIPEELVKIATQLAADTATKSIITQVKDFFHFPRSLGNEPISKKDLKAQKKILKRERSIDGEYAFYKQRDALINSARSKINLGGGNPLDPETKKSIIDIILGGGSGDFDDDFDPFFGGDDDYSDDVDPFYPPPPPQDQPDHSSSIDFSKIYPVSEMEFENLITRVESGARGKNVEIEKAALQAKLEVSPLSEKAKTRLIKKIKKIGR